jgi:hypothetical protein
MAATKILPDQLNLNETFNFTESPTIYKPINDGNPFLKMGASSAECVTIQAVFAGGTQTISQFRQTIPSTASYLYFIGANQVMDYNGDILDLTTASQIKLAGVTTAENVDGKITTYTDYLQSPEGLYSEQQLASVDGVQVGTSAANATIFTVPTGKTLVITKGVMRNLSATNAMASLKLVATIDATPFDVSETLGLSMFTSSLSSKVWLAKDGCPVCAAGTVISTAQVTPTGARQTVTIDLFGYYI